MTQTHERIQKWKALLLDLGKRNQLISFKPKKSSTLEFVYFDAPNFVEHIFEHKKLEVASLFAKKNQSILDDYLDDEESSETKNIEAFGISLKDKDQYSSFELTPVIEAFLDSQKKTVQSKWAFTNRSRKSQNKILLSLKKTAKSHIEETSVNVLYFAVSFLEYYDSESSSTPVFAPLFLIPAMIEQTTVNNPFTLSAFDEELVMNETLIKKMELDFGLDFKFVFPEEQEDAASMTQYYEHIQKQFDDPRWKINSEVHLGVFKFSTIHMVNDIEKNIDIIAENDIISRLSGNLDYIESIDQSVDTIDLATLEPADVFAVLDADSSQMMAVEAAKSGKSFVLQGPPGTGKSQTITNIIAELIAQKKKVLFVSEKKAALEVVYSNLSKVGLQGYALALHGAKANKKEILVELKTALDKSQNTEQISDRQVNDIYQTYRFHRNKLESYASKLIEPRTALEMSVYEVYGRFFKYQTATELLFDIDAIETISTDLLYKMQSTVVNYASLSNRLQIPIHQSLWRHLEVSRMSSTLKKNLEQQLSMLRRPCQTIAEQFSVIPSLSPDILLMSSMNEIITFITLVQKHQILEWPMLQSRLTVEDRSRFENLEILNNTINRLSDGVLLNYLEKFTESPSLSKYYELLTVEFKSPLKRLISSEYKAFKQQLQSYMLIPSTFKYKDAVIHLEQALEWVNALKHRQLIERDLVLQTDSYQQQDTDWPKLFSMLDALYETKTVIDQLTSQGIIPATLSLVFDDAREMDTTNLKLLRQQITEIHSLKDTLKTSFETENDIFENLYLSDVIASLTKLDVLMTDLDDALNINQLRLSMQMQHLGDFIRLSDEEGIPDDVELAFLKRFYQLWVDYVKYEEPVFANFTQAEYERTREEFASHDKQLIQIGKAKIDRRFYEQSVDLKGLESQRYDVRLLTKETSKKRKVMPLRRLFEEIPELIMSLKPVFMMSPLSVSLFLESNKFLFDVVIFDEASQIKTESAVVALYRGKQHIIVGDKEQLPPTNFFNKAGDDDDTNYEDDVNAFDSILDESSVVMSNIPLTWHYRSRYEQLIHFSNATIYKNLTSFPTPTEKVKYTGVDFEYVDRAVYYRGSSGATSNTNPLEASKVVDLIFDHFRMFGHKRTLGVVTLGSSQMKEVEKQLYRRRKDDPSFDEFFSEEGHEPFFIKNIETVQGDERDTIILSIGFGKDQNERLTMNFGPINQEGGYRRLNVAITRAKLNVILVSSIMDTDIDLSKTEARGVKLLKQYIEYARNGNEFAMEVEPDRPGWFDSPFEEDVHDFLVSKGYKIKTQVGVAGFRVDIGVEHPKNHKDFLLGIECDGATYHSSKVARDRDRLRQEILENRGWTIYRIWSTEWFHRRQQERTRLIAFIEQTLEKGQRKKTIKEPVIKVEVEKVLQKGESLSVLSPDSNEAREWYKSKISTLLDAGTRDQISFVLGKYVVKDHASYPNLVELYSRALTVPATTMYQNKIKNTLQILSVALAPIEMNVFYSLVAPLYGYKVVNNNVKQMIRADIQGLLPRGLIRISDFLTIELQEPLYRPVGANSTERKIDQVHDNEINMFVKYIMNKVRIIEVDQLRKLFAEYIGQNRVSMEMRDRLDKTCELLSMDNILQISKDIIELR